MLDREIIKEVFNATGKSISRRSLWSIRQIIKKESYYWYQSLRENHYSYIHEFKERIREIEALMKKHYELIGNNPDSPTIQQKSLEELHRLNITLSNYYDVAPSIVGAYPTSKKNLNQNRNDSISISQKDIIV
jgi:hypothetical protein